MKILRKWICYIIIISLIALYPSSFAETDGSDISGIPSEDVADANEVVTQAAVMPIMTQSGITSTDKILTPEAVGTNLSDDAEAESTVIDDAAEESSVTDSAITEDRLFAEQSVGDEELELLGDSLDKINYNADKGIFKDLMRKEIMPKLPNAGTYVEDNLLVKTESSGLSLMSGEPLNASDEIEEIEEWEYLFSITQGGDGLSLMSEESDTVWNKVTLKPGSDMIKVWKQLLKCENVLTVQPNFIYSVDLPAAAGNLTDPSGSAVSGEETSSGALSFGEISNLSESDPFENEQDWLELMKAPEAWEYLTKVNSVTPGAHVVVAVIDTGIDEDHPDLKDNLWNDGDGHHGVNFTVSDSAIDKDYNINDDHGHGTHVSGIIAAAKNGIGTTGVAYGAKIMTAKVFGSDGSGSNSSVVKAINYAVDNDADIINMSLGGYYEDEALADAVEAASEKGCLIVAAAGNEAHPTCYDGDAYYGGCCIPANYTSVLSVMAMSRNAGENGDWLTSFSNYDADPGEGYEHSLMAPGSEMLSTCSGGGYVRYSGTSMACPAVAGAAAVLMSLGCKRDEAWDRLIGSGDVKQGKTSADGKNVYNYPSLNLEKAVKNESGEGSSDSTSINGSVSLSCSAINVCDKTIELGFFDFYDNALFQGGQLKSEFILNIDNCGVSAQKIEISGTVGGIAIEKKTIGYMAPGSSTTAALTVSNTPVISNGILNMELTLTPYRNHTSSSAVKLIRSYKVIDVTLPNAITKSIDSVNQPYLELKDDLAIDGNISGAALFLPYELRISGHSFTISNSAICLDSEGSISAASGAAVSVSNCLLTGNAPFTYKSDNNAIKSQFIGNAIYDPYIEIENNGDVLYFNNFYHAGGLDTIVDAQNSDIKYSKFYDIPYLKINCRDFKYNMVNQCTDCTLKCRSACYNSFVENGNYFPLETTDDIGSMSVLTNPYMSSSAVGFYNNCVVGPMSVKNLDGKDTVVIGETYYQTVNDYDSENDGNYMIEALTEENDKLTCKDSIIYPDPESPATSCAAIFSDINRLRQSEFAVSCPAFVTDVKCEKASVYSDLCIGYTLKYDFNTPIDVKDKTIDCYSYYDYIRNGMNVSEYIGSCKEDYSCTLSGIKKFTEYKDTQCYMLSGYNTAGSNDNYIPTAIEEQYMFRFPVVFDLSVYDTDLELSAEATTSGIQLTWRGDIYSEGEYTEIYRSDKDHPYAQIATVSGIYTYIDTTAKTGIKYTYIAVSSTNNRYGLADCFLSSGGKINIGFEAFNLSSTGSAVSISFSEAMRLSSLEFDILYDGEFINLDSVNVSGSLTSDGMAVVPLGVRKVSDSAVRVFVGPGEGEVSVGSEGILTIVMENKCSFNDMPVTAASVKVDGEPFDIGNEESEKTICIISTNDMGSKMMRSSSNDNDCRLWVDSGISGERAYAALYDTDGMMLDVKVLEADKDCTVSLVPEEEGTPVKLKTFSLSDLFAPSLEAGEYDI